MRISFQGPVTMNKTRQDSCVPVSSISILPSKKKLITGDTNKKRIGAGPPYFKKVVVMRHEIPMHYRIVLEQQTTVDIRPRV